MSEYLHTYKKNILKHEADRAREELKIAWVPEVRSFFLHVANVAENKLTKLEQERDRK